MNSILIADDDKFFREQLNKFLLMEKYNAKAVSNGKEAVKELVENEYDALILDMYMEEINGKQTISIIKNIKPKMPIIVITGDSSLELEREIRSCGVFYYLVKPFEMKELKEVIDSAIKKKQ